MRMNILTMIKVIFCLYHFDPNVYTIFPFNIHWTTSPVVMYVESMLSTLQFVVRPTSSFISTRVSFYQKTSWLFTTTWNSFCLAKVSVLIYFFHINQSHCLKPCFKTTAMTVTNRQAVLIVHANLIVTHLMPSQFPPD